MPYLSGNRATCPPSHRPVSYLAGIDEAGYGPSLGPLVISTVVFKTTTPKTNLPKLLHRITSPHLRPDKLTVCDSKKIYSSAAGLGHLEKTALAFLWQIHPVIFQNNRSLTIKNVLEKIIVDFPDSTSCLPGYQNMDSLSLPLKVNLQILQPLAQRLAEELRKNSVKLCDLRIRLVTVSQFNRDIKQGNNKADLLFNHTGRLLSYLYRQYLNSYRGGCIYAGKQGGRAYYQSHLNNLFGTNEVKIIKESPTCSAYQIGPAGRLEFVQDGEDRHFVIALASIFSKYVRELFMTLFNNFWQKHYPELKPTAGYPNDARRFLNDIDFFIKKLNVSPDDLVRMR
ncbi:MAG: hypothetical protein AAB019_02290 [Planctomycetota bacterium]